MRRTLPKSKSLTSRQGVALAEVLVASVLTLAAVSVIGVCLSSSRRLMQDGEEYRLAVDELANQLAKIEVSDDDIDQVLDELRLSEFTTERLAGAELEHTSEQDELGMRIVLSLNWQRLGNPPPVTLAGWVVAEREVAVDSPAEGDVP